MNPLRCTLNISLFFPQTPLAVSLDGAVSAGFHTIGLLDPYSVGLDDLDPELRRGSPFEP